MLIPDCANLGWRRNTILMKDIIKYLFKLFTHEDLRKDIKSQIRDIIRNNSIGKNIKRNNLKKALELKGPFIS